MGLGKFVNPRLWASLKPLGLGQQRPNNYMEIVKAGWENRDRAGYAWRILNEGCCDGCALGTKGMRDWTIEGTHLCNIRLRLLRMNTRPAVRRRGDGRRCRAGEEVGDRAARDGADPAPVRPPQRARTASPAPAGTRRST